MLVAKALVQRYRAGVLDDHLEPDALDAARAGLLVHRLHQRPPDAGAAFRRDDPDAADPGVAPADAEVRETDARAIANGDPRRARSRSKVAVEGAHGARVDRERHEIALVRRGEERGELVVRELRGRRGSSAPTPRA